MMRISKDLEWVRPYIDLAIPIIPRLAKLKSIKLVSPKRDQMVRQFGAMVPDATGKKYTMTLYAKYKIVERLKPKPRLKVAHLSKLDILDTLAHEIAHLEHWDHTPQHKITEAKLKMMFMVKLLEQGYISEEEEMKTKRSRIE